MDLVDVRRGALPRDRGARSRALGAQLGIADVRAVPISALRGRQRRRRLRRGWRGTTAPPLLEQLETRRGRPRPQPRRRALPGAVDGARRRLPRLRGPGRRRRAGDRRRGRGAAVTARARGSRAIDTPHGPVERAFPPMVATLRLEDELDVGRGDCSWRGARRAGGRARARRDRLLDGRGARPRRRALPAQAHDAPGAGEHRRRSRRGVDIDIVRGGRRPTSSGSTTSGG